MTAMMYTTRILIGFVLLFLISFSTGCPWKKTDENVQVQKWKRVEPNDSFKLLVIGDPEIARKAGQLVGTWEETTKSTYTVSEMTVDVFKNGTLPDVDAVIAPLELEGLLLQKDFPGVIKTDGKDFPKEEWNDLFDLQKYQMTRCGRDMKMVPFGSRFCVCYYRADLLEKLGENPPETWPEYSALCEKLNQEFSGDSGWNASLEPTAAGWAAKTFLSRVAPYATHRDFYSMLFDLNTMEPLLNTEPFVRALTEMKQVNPALLHFLTPDQVRDAFWSGKCGLAITFPASQPMSETVVASDVQAGICPLPGAIRAFNPQSKKWDARLSGESQHVPAMIEGRLAMISAKSTHPEATLDLLLWLSGEEWGTEVLAASNATGISRKSQLRRPTQWVEKQMPPKTMSQYITVLNKQMAGNTVLVIPSLPGQDEYLQVLDEHVRKVLSGEMEPQAALDAVGEQWKLITERYGLESQKQLYRQSCGLATK